MSRGQGWNQKKPLGIITLEFGCSMNDYRSHDQMGAIMKKWNQKSHCQFIFMNAFLNWYKVCFCHWTAEYRCYDTEWLFLIPSLAAILLDEANSLYFVYSKESSLLVLIRNDVNLALQGANGIIQEHIFEIIAFIDTRLRRFQRYDLVLSVLPKRCHQKAENRNVGYVQ